MRGIERLFNRIDVLADEMDEVLNHYPDFSFKPKKKYRAIWAYSEEDRRREDISEARAINYYKSLMNESAALLGEAAIFLDRNGARGSKRKLDSFINTVGRDGFRPQEYAEFVRACVGMLRARYYQIDE